MSLECGACFETIRNQRRTVATLKRVNKRSEKNGGQSRLQTKVEWTSNEAYQQFRLWKKEVERIVNGPLSKAKEEVKINTIYIWAGAYAENLIEAKQAEDNYLKLDTVEKLLEALGSCLTHSTFLREAREDF